MEKMTWGEACEYMRKWNREHGVTVKGTSKEDTIWAVAVISEDSFKQPYELKSRSYAFSNDNKAFIPDMLGTSIFSYCLDGTDQGVRLDYYVHDSWKVEYVYFAEYENLFEGR